MNKRYLFTLFCFITFFSGAQKLKKDNLLGSYKLKRIDYIYTDTTIVVNPSQSGFLVISPLRYAIGYNPGLSPRVAFADLSNPTESEMLAGFRSFAFNSGSYSFKGQTFTAKPDFAKVPGFEGGEQVYAVTYEDGLTSFSMYDETYPNGDKPGWYGKLKIKLYFEKE